jgi:hypothetical protein
MPVLVRAVTDTAVHTGQTSDRPLLLPIRAYRQVQVQREREHRLVSAR